jgi:cobalt/nickel transport system permease protein
MPDPRASLLLLLAYLIALSTLPVGANLSLLLFAVIPLLLIFLTGSPATQMLSKAAYVLPFSFAIAAVALVKGQTAAAVFFLFRSYLSILAVVLATHLVTTLEILRAMERLGAPRFLIIVTEFLLRYLEVLRREADSIRLAALCRGATHNRLIAASTLGMLFVRSLERSTGIHNAMLARGFRGQIPRPFPLRWSLRDTGILATGLFCVTTLRLAL